MRKQKRNEKKRESENEKKRTKKGNLSKKGKK